LTPLKARAEVSEERTSAGFNAGVVITIVIAVVLWGSAPAGIRAALPGYHPAHLSLLRFGIASLLLAVYVAFAGLRLPDERDWFLLILAGGIGITFYNIILNYGLVTVPAATGSFVISTTPIWTALLAVITLGERLTRLGWAGTLLSFAGIAVIARERGDGLHFSSGALIILVGAISYGIYMVLQKKLLGKYTALEVTCYTFWAGTLLMMPFAPGLLEEIRMAPRNATWAVVYLGIFPAAVANLAWAYTLSRVAAAQVSSYLYLMPVVTVAIAWIWLGELPTMLTLAGGLIALAGVLVMHKWGHA
jgi:drug/metabolite transporter (DMT)-like permease